MRLKIISCEVFTREICDAAARSVHQVDLVFNFGSSGDLSKQIIAAAKADVFLSADEKEMDSATTASRDSSPAASRSSSPAPMTA